MSGEENDQQPDHMGSSGELTPTVVCDNNGGETEQTEQPKSRRLQKRERMAKNRADQGITDDEDQPPHYFCPSCGELFSSWKLCYRHLAQTLHIDVVKSLKGVQARCMTEVKKELAKGFGQKMERKLANRIKHKEDRIAAQLRKQEMLAARAQAEERRELPRPLSCKTGGNQDGIESARSSFSLSPLPSDRRWSTDLPAFDPFLKESSPTQPTISPEKKENIKTYVKSQSAEDLKPPRPQAPLGRPPRRSSMPGTGVWALNPQEEQNKQWKDQRARSPLVRLGEMAKPPVVRLREISELSPSSPQLFPDDNTGLPSFALDDGANWLMQVVQDDSDEDNSDDNPDHCTLPPQDASNWSALVKGGEEGASGTVNRGKHRGGSQGENRRGSLPTEDRKGSGPMLQGTRQQMFRGSIVAETVEGDESLFHLLTRRNRKVGMEGTRVLCKYKEDSKTWKSAQIVSVRAEDSVHVKFDGYEDVVELPPNHVRIIPADYDNQSDTPAPPAKSQTIGKQSGPAAKPLGKPAKSKRKRNSAPSTKGPTGPS